MSAWVRVERLTVLAFTSLPVPITLKVSNWIAPPVVVVLPSSGRTT